ncbi:MAG: protein-tyrosine phosphatase [Gammaproteobacteria bacterium]|nr:MAG: protein-tyrosine phosphatase [Gammaproteobacteria bacterium]TND07332.1 MAG: protein-tyrosine phosphatase [Gammaproteobacteria bacterium]
MIDIHSHILPGVDDGAPDLTEALAMLRMAEQDGVTTQVLTPHIQPGRFDNTRDELTDKFAAFKQTAAHEGININLKLAAEVHIGPHIMEYVTSDKMPWLGEWQGARVFLLEFPHRTIPVGSINVVHWLTKQNIRPMIAHPERNRDVQRNPEKLQPFIDAGCLLQITAASLAGRFGEAAYRLSVGLLDGGDVTILATDCHDSRVRPPILGEGVKLVSEVIGKEAALALATTAPQQLLGDDIH